MSIEVLFTIVPIVSPFISSFSVLRRMNVNANNVDEAFELYSALLDETLFVSIDAEFGGIRHRFQYDENGRKLKSSRSIEERYQRNKEDASRYPILQLGLCLWTRDSGEGYQEPRWKAFPFNIDVNPRVDPFLRFERDVTFSTGALDFLVDHGFDIGAPLMRGVRYLNGEEEIEVLKRQSVQSGSEDREQSSEALDEEAALFLEDAETRVRQWAASLEDDATTDIYLNIFTSNGYHRRLLYRKVENAWTDPDHPNFPQWLSSSKASVLRNGLMVKSHRDVQAMVVRPLQQSVLEAERSEREKYRAVKLQRARGITNWIELLIKRAVPIIGHNLFQDLSYLLCNLYLGYLPESLAGFAKISKHLFGKGVLDTKTIALSRVHQIDLEQADFTPTHQIDFHSRTGRGSGTSLGELTKWADHVAIAELARIDLKREQARLERKKNTDDDYEDYVFATTKATQSVEEPTWNQYTEPNTGLPGWGECDAAEGNDAMENVESSPATVAQESGYIATAELQDAPMVYLRSAKSSGDEIVDKKPSKSKTSLYAPIVTDLAFSGYGSFSAQRDHEAGFDAFKTGQVFLRMFETVAARNGEALSSIRDEKDDTKEAQLQAFVDYWKDILSVGGTMEKFIVLDGRVLPTELNV